MSKQPTKFTQYTKRGHIIASGSTFEFDENKDPNSLYLIGVDGMPGSQYVDLRHSGPKVKDCIPAPIEVDGWVFRKIPSAALVTLQLAGQPTQQFRVVDSTLELEFDVAASGRIIFEFDNPMYEKFEHVVIL